MEDIIYSLQCWWREKEEVVKKPDTPPPPNNVPKAIYCSCCFKYIENETFLVQKAKIGKKIFGFCGEECYLEWLSSPSTMLFGKIN